MIDFEARRRQADQLASAAPIRQAPSGSPQAQADPEREKALGVLGTAGDILNAVPAGVEDAAHGLYGLADTLAFGALPDWETRVFGHSRTAVGGLIESITNFSTGFIPLFGFGRWAGLLAKAGGIGRALEGATVLKGAVAGAIADFAVFDGHSGRLSDLVQQFPALQNPVTEYLSSKKDDPELLGRFKSVLEGLGVGAFVEVASLGLKSLWHANRARAAGKSVEEVAAAVDKAVPSKKVEEAYRSAVNTDPNAPPVQPAGSALAPEAIEATTQPVVEVKPIPAPAATEAGSREILSTFDLSDQQIDNLLHVARSRDAAGLPPNVSPRGLSEAERFAQGMQLTDLNMSRYDGPDGAQQILRAMEQTLAPLKGLGEASATTLSKQEAAGLHELADLVGEKNPHRMMASMARDLPDLQSLNRRVLAYKTGTLSYASYVNRLAVKLANPQLATDALRLELAAGMNTLADMSKLVKGMVGEHGRGLGSHRTVTRAQLDLFDSAAVTAALEDFGGTRRIDDLAAKFRVAYESSAAAATGMAESSAGSRAAAMGWEAWYNFLVGRPTTAVTNFLSDSLAAVYLPFEKMAGAAATGQSRFVREAAREYAGLVQSASESLQATRAIVKGGGQLLDPSLAAFGEATSRRRAITAANAGLDPESVSGRAVEWLGKGVRLPTAVLGATDQGFQQLNYRGVARAQFMEQAAQQFPNDLSAQSRFVVDELDKLILNGQAYGEAQLYNRGAKEAVELGLKSKTAIEAHARQYTAKAVESGEFQRLSAVGDVALRRAQEATFSAPLERGTVGHSIQQLTIRHPAIRLVLPFVKISVNLAKFAGQRLDAPGAVKGFIASRFPVYARSLEGSRNRFVRDVLSGDPRRRAEAIGRITMGMSAATLVMFRAAQEAEDGMPLITGRGPVDKEQRRILEDAGWQAYSVRVGNKYVSYNRLDPFATVVGLAADFVNTVKYAGDEDQPTVEQLSLGLATALANNFTNKTYLAGLSNFLAALQDPKKAMPGYLRSLIGTAVPGTVAGAVPATDPLVRDVQSIADTLQSRLPGASASLPPLRNVLGEPVRRAPSLGGAVSSVFNAFVPILYREVSDDGVRKELANLGHGFTPPRRERAGIDLSAVRSASGQTAYDRWLELHGQVKVGGRTLKRSLQDLFKSEAYRRIDPYSTDEVESPRIRLVRDVLDDYRYSALRQLQREFPELALAEKQQLANKRRAALGQQQAQSGNSLLDALRGASR